MKFRRLALFLLVVVAVVGCNNEKNRNLIDKRADQASRIGEEAQQPAPKKMFDPLHVTEKVWAGNAALRLRSGMPLPGKYETTRGVTLILSEPAPLNEIAASIGAQTGIPVRVLANGTAAGASAAGLQPTNTPMPISYEGPLSGLLDLVAGNYGLNWRYDGASVSFSRFVTRVFVVESLPGTQSIKDGIGEDTSSEGSSGSSSSSTSGGGGGSFSVSSTSSLSQSSEMTVEMKVWDELADTVKAMLGGVGTSVVSPSSGTITVSTTPDIMRTVARFVEEENKRLSQQIGINVEVYSVALQDGSDFNVAFNTILDGVKGFKANITSVAPVSSATLANAGTLSVAILDRDGIGQITDAFKALSTVGDTTRVAQFPMTTLNNRPISRRIGRDRTYVAASTFTPATATTAATTSITPGTIREGFSLQLTPRLLEDGRVMLQYSLSLIDIINIRTFNSETGEASATSGGTGSATVQLPETSSRVFVQQSMLKSGSTLVLAGYDDEQVSQTSQGMGDAYNYFFGGGSVNNKTRTMLFIAITPQVLDVPRESQEL